MILTVSENAPLKELSHRWVHAGTEKGHNSDIWLIPTLLFESMNTVRVRNCAQGRLN